MLNALEWVLELRPMWSLIFCEIKGHHFCQYFVVRRKYVVMRATTRLFTLKKKTMNEVVLDFLKDLPKVG